MSTTRTLIIGFIVAVLATIPTYQWVFHQQPTSLPLYWASAGMGYMATFFHEIGHTLAYWYYGYISVPSFDFQHGGGMAYAFGGSNPLIVAGAWGFLAYGIYNLREYRVIAGALIALLLFNFATVWNEGARQSIIGFMGPGFEPLVAGFLLFRAIFDLAPRGWFERLLNAIIGFGMIFRVFIESVGLLHNQTHRLTYYTQKGSHGFGDFDRVADNFAWLSFEMVVYGWIGLTVICLALPFALKIFYTNGHEHRYSQ